MILISWEGSSYNIYFKCDTNPDWDYKKKLSLRHYFLINQQEQLGKVSGNFNLSGYALFIFYVNKYMLIF